MTRLRLGHSFWLDRRSNTGPRLPSLRGDHDADVAIVGGGVTGCACAYLLAREGVRVILVDAQRLGHGSTAASTALIMQEPDTDFRKLADRYGRAVAARMWRASRRGVRDFIDTLAALRFDAEIRRLPSIYFATEARRGDDLRREQLARARAGLPGRWLTSSALTRIAGVSGGGAILTRGNAEIDPVRACLALARAAAASGARLFAHSTARRVTRTANGVEIHLDRGRVRAGRVIVATGYATPEFKPLAGRFRMSTTYVIATPRLSRAAREAVGLGDVMLWDTERPYHYVRWTADHRLLFGGRDRPQPPRPRQSALARSASDLAVDLQRLFPALEGIEPEYAWEGLFASTPDGLPYIGPHRRYPDHLFALGYGGNGMSFGFHAAQILSRSILGRPRPDDELFSFNRQRELGKSQRDS